MTIPNAAVRSIATQTYNVEVYFDWKPIAISLGSCSKAEVVDCPGRKPCWSVDGSSWLSTVVVFLPRPMEGNGVTPIFRSLQDRQFHHRRLESLGHFNT